MQEEQKKFDFAIDIKLNLIYSVIVKPNAMFEHRKQRLYKMGDCP